MRILLTNDDGIHARGLDALARELSAIADCLVVAPEQEQSAIGHAITLFRPLRVEKVNKENRLFGYAVSGTPADCVKIGIIELSEKPVDVVVSGINLGANVGVNVIYSGTVSAATEGTIMGYPSIAVSLNTLSKTADFSYAARFVRQLATLIVETKIIKGITLNINIPALPEDEIKGVRVTRQGSEQLVETYERRIDPRNNVYYWLTGEISRTDNQDDNTDIIALQKNMISITPIHHDLTKHDALTNLEKRIPDLLFPIVSKVPER